MAIRIGNTRADDGRAARLRITAGGDVTYSDRDSTPHSAVGVTAFVLVDSISDANKLIDNMPTLIAALDHAAAEILKV